MIIAVDGYSSCGKSTLSKALASELGYIYIDTGAMYRAITLYFLDHEIDINCDSAVSEALKNITVSFRNVDGVNTSFLNNTNIEHEIRGMRVSSFVSEVASISQVRDESVAMQRIMAIGKDVVMDGRDIGTVVFPHAELKLFVTADTEIRAQRRYEELLAAGKPVTLDQIKENIAHRDHIDTTREHSPLRQATDAHVIDTSDLSKKEQMDMALRYVAEVSK